MNSMEQEENPTRVADPMWVASREGRATRGPTEMAILNRRRFFAVFRFREWAFPTIMRTVYWGVLALTELGAAVRLYRLAESGPRFMEDVTLWLMGYLTAYMLLAPLLLRLVHDVLVLLFAMGVAWLRVLERRAWG